MNVFMVTLGTRGDLEPFWILGQELRARGHRVVIGTSAFYESYVREGDMEWTPVGNGTRAQLLAVLDALTAIPDRALRTWHYASQWLLPQFQMSIDHVRAQAEAADYFVNNLRLIWTRGNAVIPGALLFFDPDEIPTGPVERDPAEILNLAVTNKQLVDPQNQVHEQYRFTGFWQPTRPAIPEPAPELTAFLKAGPPPVVVTLGSMVLRDPDEVAAALSEALQLAGRRGVIVTGWSRDSQSAPWFGDVLCVNVAPYDWLFPQASCVVHHGGPGTFSAVLRAGKVSVALPQTKGQEMYALALGQHGLATGCFEITNLHPPTLAAAIHRAVTDEQFQRNARAWQKIIGADPGVCGAVDLIEEHWKSLQTH